MLHWSNEQSKSSYTQTKLSMKLKKKMLFHELFLTMYRIKRKPQYWYRYKQFIFKSCMISFHAFPYLRLSFHHTTVSPLIRRKYIKRDKWSLQRTSYAKPKSNDTHKELPLTCAKFQPVEKTPTEIYQSASFECFGSSLLCFLKGL